MTQVMSSNIAYVWSLAFDLKLETTKQAALAAVADTAPLKP